MNDTNEFNSEVGPNTPPPAPSQGNGMYNPMLEKLIDLALADGELTESEKQVLFKRAQAQGIDLAEFEMVLDARLYEKRKSVEHTKPQNTSMNSAPKSEKCGDVRKCPACGAMIGTFIMSCPECGHEFIGVGANNFVKEFTEGLKAAIERADILSARRMHNTSGGLVGTMQALIDMQQQTLEQAGIIKDERLPKIEAEYVKTAVLPRAKEDCIEMLNFLLPKIKVSGANYATKEWRKYYIAILEKLELGAGRNKELETLIAYYQKKFELSGFESFLLWWRGLTKQMKILIGVAAFYIFFFGLLGVLVSIN